MIKRRARVALVLALCTVLQLCGTAALAADAPQLDLPAQVEEAPADAGVAVPQPSEESGPAANEAVEGDLAPVPAEPNLGDEDMAPAPSVEPTESAPDGEWVVTIDPFDRTSKEMGVHVENAPEDTLSMEIRVRKGETSRVFSAERTLEGEYRNWEGSISFPEFAYECGLYRISVVALQGRGEEITLEDTLRGVMYDAAGMRVVDEAGDGKAYRLTASGVMLPPDTATWFEVWSDDPAVPRRVCLSSRSGDDRMGTYPISADNVPGTYHAALVLGDSLGVRRQIAQADFEVVGASSAQTRFASVDGHTGALRAEIAAEAPSGIESARVEIWTKDDRSDLRELDCESENGCFVASDNISEHAGAYGTYNVQGWIVLGNGMTLSAGTAAASIWPVNIIRSAVRESNGNVRITMVGPSPKDQGFRLAAWSNANGQDDVVWYNATLQSDGTVTAVVNPRRHRSSGAFTAHMYAGNTAVAAAEFNVPSSDMVSGAQRRISEDCQKVYNQVGRDLYANYMWVVNNFSYTRRYGHLTPPAGYTREQWYAVEGLETRRGNCYTFAASFAALARGLGYNAQYVEGAVYGVGQKWWPHGFVFIRMNGSTYICDPELQFASSRGRNLYMQPISSPKATYRW